MWLATAVLTGLAAGGTHVVTGPDHMAAVAPLAIDSKRKSWKAGLMWGGLSVLDQADLTKYR